MPSVVLVGARGGGGMFGATKVYEYLMFLQEVFASNQKPLDEQLARLNMAAATG